MNIELTKEQAGLIEIALERLRESVWDDPSAYDFTEYETGEYNETEIQKWIDENINEPLNQIRKLNA